VTVAVPRFATERNPDRETLGHEVAETAKLLGFELMPWQRELADVMYELTPAGTLFYKEARITTPRQSGKTTFTLARQVHRALRSEALGWGRRPLGIFTAQTATAARAKLKHDWFPTIEFSAAMANVKRFVYGSGTEAVEFTNGARMITVPPSETAGHGQVVDVVDLDEAFAYPDARAEQALRPAMITRKSPQIVVTSTAGTQQGSPYLWAKVEDGRARTQSSDESTGVCYFEWSAAPGEDRSDPDVWARCMPALGHTVPLEAIQTEFDTLPEDEFDRAYLNRWTGSLNRIIPRAAWDASLDSTSQVDGRVWLAVDASPGVGGGRTAAIAVGGYRSDGTVHVEVVEHAAGLSWVAQRVGELTRKWSVARLYIDPVGPIGSVLRDIQLEANTSVEVIDVRTMAAACVRFHEAVLENTVKHLDQPNLDLAVDGAAKRLLGDSWAWARRTSTTDICPLVAVTLAHWAVVNDVQHESIVIQF
jgi:hypothetical protein